MRECSLWWSALEYVEKSQGSSGYVNDEKCKVVQASEQELVLGERKEEYEDRCFGQLYKTCQLPHVHRRRRRWPGPAW